MTEEEIRNIPILGSIHAIERKQPTTKTCRSNIING